MILFQGREKTSQRLIRVSILIALPATILAALTAVWHTPVELLPALDFPQVQVLVHQDGSSAVDLEHQWVAPLEAQILNLPDLASVHSVMGHGSVELDIRFRGSYRAGTDLLNVEAALARAQPDLPQGVQPHAELMGQAVQEVDDEAAEIPRNVDPVLVQHAVRAYVVPALRAIPGVQSVQAFGAGDESLWVQPDVIALQHYNVGVEQLVAAIADQFVFTSAGALEWGHQDVPIEIRSLPLHRPELAQLPVSTGTETIPLDALARIDRTGIPEHHAVELDGHGTVALRVVKQPGVSTTVVDAAIQRVLQQTQNDLPRGVRWVQLYSQGHLVHQIEADLGRNLFLGAFFAVLVLFAVLGSGRQVIVLALSIPLSLLLGIAGLHLLGQDLNIMTLGALTVAVGLLADDAIIILESIQQRWSCGDQHWEGIRNGVRHMLVPDISGTLTNMAMYVPLLFVSGLTAVFFVPFALAMVLALLASLLVSLIVIPLGLGLMGRSDHSDHAPARSMLQWLRHGNQVLFRWVSRAPRLSLGLTLLVMVLSVGVLAWLPVDFLPLPGEGALLVSFTLPPGSSLAQTEEAAARMSARMRTIDSVQHVYARMGSAASTDYTEPAYAGEITLVLRSGIAVQSLGSIGEQIRSLARLPGVQIAVDTPTVERVGESLSGLPQPFILHLFGNQVAVLRPLAEQITQRLRQIPALSDVFDNDGYPVIDLEIEPVPQALQRADITAADLARQIHLLIAGQVIAEVPHGVINQAIYLRLADATQQSPQQLAALPVKTGHGFMPLGQLANVRFKTVPNQLHHVMGVRSLDILATPNGPLMATEQAARSALKGLQLPRGYRIAFGGLAEEIEGTLLTLLAAGVMALALLLAILMLQFEGWLIPALLMLEIPLALTGGLVALAVSGLGINATGMIGLLTLVGMGLRHSIVLFDRIQRNERNGMSAAEAVEEAIQVRFRPIVLTVLTAALGMLPTAMGWGVGAAPEQGLAVVLLGGLLWSAIRSTNLIPALYLDQRNKGRAAGEGI